MHEPVEIPTRETARFVSRYLPGSSVILEVGSGGGHVAAALQKEGHRVTGLDSDQDAVDRARALGVTMIQATWPTRQVQNVDAIVFTRSLHHIDPLDDCLNAARDVLKRSGVLLAEEFAFAEIDLDTINWFVQMLTAKEALRLIRSIPDEFVTGLVAADDPEVYWSHDNGHHIHSSRQMQTAIETYFCDLHVERVPYLYRYVVPVLPRTPEAARLVGQVFREELRLGGMGKIQLIGRRFAATGFLA